MAITNKLTDTERNMFLFTLPVINNDLDNFVDKFYSHFLQTKAKELFKDSNMKLQHKMFSTAINVILTHATEPSLLDSHLQNLVKIHSKYGNMSNYIEVFIDSFMEALKETLVNRSNDEVLNIWYKVLVEIMNFFIVNVPHD